MPINLQALVGQAFGLAKALVPAAFGSSTVRFGPTVAVNHATDQSVTTWAHTAAGIDLLEYDDKNERDDTETPEGTLKAFAMQGSDMPAGAEASQAGEVESAGVVWQIYRITPDPTRSIFIIHARR